MPISDTPAVLDTDCRRCGREKQAVQYVDDDGPKVCLVCPVCDGFGVRR